MKLIKIKLTQTWRSQGRTYPHDTILDIDPKYFDSTVMIKYVEPVKTEEPKHSTELLEPQAGGVPPSATETEVTVTTEESPPDEEPKPTRRRRKKSS